MTTSTLENLINTAKKELSLHDYQRAANRSLAQLITSKKAPEVEDALVGCTGKEREHLLDSIWPHAHNEWADQLDPDFEAECLRPSYRLTVFPQFSNDLDNLDFEDTVLSDTPFNDIWSSTNQTWSTLWAYMIWRFGNPYVIGNEDRNRTAGWILSTPEDDIHVLVSPQILGASLSFTYLTPLQDSAEAPATETIDAIRAKTAIRTTLLDLLRPIRLNDNFFNAAGTEYAEYYQEGEEEYDTDLEPRADAYSLDIAVIPYDAKLVSRYS